MNAVAEDRNIGHAGIEVDEELVRDAFKIIEHQNRRKIPGVDEDHLAAHLVDGDQAPG